jgi:hypothetical protein
MKIYIITAAILFCSKISAMDNSKENRNSLDIALVAKASGYDIDLLISEYNMRVRTRNKGCTLKKLLSPCRYFNPFKSKL